MWNLILKRFLKSGANGANGAKRGGPKITKI